jgi:hypothetical protein
MPQQVGLDGLALFDAVDAKAPVSQCLSMKSLRT